MLNSKNDNKTYHIAAVLSICDTNNLFDLSFTPSRTFFSVLAASFTRGFVDPAADPAHVYGAVLTSISTLFVLTSFVIVVIVVVVVVVIEQASNNIEGAVLVSARPFHSL